MAEYYDQSVLYIKVYVHSLTWSERKEIKLISILIKKENHTLKSQKDHKKITYMVAGHYSLFPDLVDVQICGPEELYFLQRYVLHVLKRLILNLMVAILRSYLTTLI